jgi:hypothetical protein
LDLFHFSTKTTKKQPQDNNTQHPTNTLPVTRAYIHGFWLASSNTNNIMKVTLREYEEDPLLEGHDDGAASFKYEYTIQSSTSTDDDNNNAIITKRTQRNTSTTTSVVGKTGVQRIVFDLFLPIGFPHSVDATYLPYQLYDALQGLCSYWRGVVSTRAVLEAAGVGNASATAMSAAMNWALRDGTGMVGGLVFSYVASPYFDTFVKEFRLFADIINDVALTLDMLAPAFGSQHSLWILSLSTICKTMCGMSATKGRITHHFARHNGNMADLTAKESTQETLVSLLGMIGGVLVAQLLEHVPYAVTWILFGFLTIVHVWANYKGVMLLKLATLNPERTQVLLENIVQVLVEEKDDKALKQALVALPTPEETNESLWSSTQKLLVPKLHVARPLEPHRLMDLRLYAELFANEKYLIGSDKYRRDHHLYIWLAVGAGYTEELKAYSHALLLQASLKQGATWDKQLLQR